MTAVCIGVREGVEVVRERRRGGGLKGAEEVGYSANLLWYRLSDIQGLLLATTHSLNHVQSASLIPKQIHTAKPDGNTLQRPRRPPEKQPS